MPKNHGWCALAKVSLICKLIVSHTIMIRNAKNAFPPLKRFPGSFPGVHPSYDKPQQVNYEAPWYMRKDKDTYAT